MGTQAHNNRVEAKVLQLQAAPDGRGALLAVNVLEITKGYFGAWKEAPGTMAAATAGDLLTTAGAAYLLKQASDGGGDDERPVINNYGGTTIIAGGDASYQRTETTTSGTP